MGVRAMARLFNCAPDTINRKICILARQATVIMSHVIENIELFEDLTADGFESFAVSQYFPNNFNILVGKDSQFVYHFDYVQLHRKGRMTDYQKKKAAELKKKWPLRRNNELIAFMEIEQKIMEMLMKTQTVEHLTVYTDEKTIYRQCFDHIGAVAKYDGSTAYVTQKQISSRQHRDLNNELFAVNYIDREIRKDMAEHHRETSCFARNVNSSVSRMMVYLFYHNFLKTYRLNGIDNRNKNHADAAGITSLVYRKMLVHLFTKRLFSTHYNLQGNNEMTWCRAYQTPLKNESDYISAYLLVG
jgi:hypothetical protein